MSYMDAQNKFNSLCIEELNLEEIEQVDGGILPIIAAALVVGGVIVVGFAIGVAVGYFSND